MVFTTTEASNDGFSFFSWKGSWNGLDKRPGFAETSCVDDFRDQLTLDFSHFIVVHGAGSFGSLTMDLQNILSLVNLAKCLNLSHNRLGGGFFHEDIILLFMNLQILDLSDNLLSGELSSFKSLPNLQVLHLESNELYGSVLEDLLGRLIPLEELDLSNNGFPGPIHVINSANLNILNLSSNALSGSLPSSLGRCLIVDLSSNMLPSYVLAMQN
ncbi:hypothetical protein U1Q18_009096 [Sarracenia purpurea var. burkii]